MYSDFNQAAKNWDRSQYKHKRAETISIQLRSQVDLSSDMKALEVGCGTGLLGFNLIEHFSFLTFADSSEGMLEKVKEKIKAQNIENADTLLIDIEKEKLLQNYDCIFALMALHHIDDYASTIKHLSAHLNKDGFLCIADLDKENGSFHKDAKAVHVSHHGISREDLKRVLANCGLQQIEESTPFIMARQFGNIRKEYPIFLITGKK